MSHIVIDAREWATSTGRYISSLVRYLDKIDSEHDYSILLKPQDIDKANLINPRFTKVACPHKEFTFQEQIGLLKQINSLKPDLVHFGKDHQPVLYRGKTVTTMHDLTTMRFINPDKQPLVFKFKQQVYKRLVKRVANTSDRIITPTEFVKQDIIAYTGASADKITVTYESADKITDLAELIDGVVGKRFIMYVGRPTPHKNLDRLIQAFVALKGQHPDLHLVLAGKLDANYQAIQQKVQNEQIANIIFTDYIDDGQLRWLYEQCEAYVVPSLSEGFGLPGVEAMLHGAPVVSSNATCLPEVYGNGAHYFDPKDVQSMSNAINEVLTDKQLRARLISAGHIKADSYSWQRMAQQTLHIYNDLLRD
ncbi:glycosyltransferase family 1 protein [soil metagenome]